MAHQQESFHPFSSRKYLSCCLSHVAKGSNPKPRVPNLSQAVWSQKRCIVPKRNTKWLPRLGLNPSTNLPLQPHFRLLPQLATAASIPGRCGPVVWSQLSPSSSGPHYKSLFGAPLLAAPCYNCTAYVKIATRIDLQNSHHYKKCVTMCGERCLLDLLW